MEFKGTNGEWSFNSGMAIMCNKISIADVWVFDVGHDESQANAKLIAAAPDLLEALQGFVNLEDLISYKGELSVEHNGEAQAVHSAIQKAKQAIEKALK